MGGLVRPYTSQSINASALSLKNMNYKEMDMRSTVDFFRKSMNEQQLIQKEDEHKSNKQLKIYSENTLQKNFDKIS